MGQKALVTGANSGIGQAVAMAPSAIRTQPTWVTGATIFVDGGMTLYPGFAHGG